jgi:prepilin-type N-terminal cleavage/methylation domain-containing protein
MTRRAAGFSLVESLVTLLVLAVGLLGLGQLQARLWHSSGELQTLEGAFLLGHDRLEARSAAWLAESGNPALSESGNKNYTIVMKEINSPNPAENITATQLELRWRYALDEHMLILTTTRNGGILPQDTRWLLRQP